MTALRGAPGAGAIHGRAGRLPRGALLGLAALGAALFGWALPTHPVEALAAACLAPLALAAPVATLAGVLFVTVLVPFDLQNQLSVGGGTGVPGLLLVEFVLLLGLVRMAADLVTRRQRFDVPLMVAWALLVALTAALGNGLVAGGASASAAGVEARCLVLGVGAFILAWPLLQHAAARRRLYVLLLFLGLALGLWGIAQWAFDIRYTLAGDVGVRPGINQIAAAGGGQLQGGLYAFPMAVILSFAVLVRHWGRGVANAFPAVVLGLNCVCVLLTYERTIWAAAAIGCLVVALRSGRRARRAAIRCVAIGAVGLAGFSALNPGTLSTTAGRLSSVIHYRSDDSVLARAVESQAVLRAIRGHPVTGAGFGTTITWGKKDVFARRTTSFTHDGYLWLMWKLGVPLALFMVGILAWAALRGRRARLDADLATLRSGSQAALIALLAICVTFPAFNTLGITAVMGLMVAVCFVPARGRA